MGGRRSWRRVLGALAPFAPLVCLVGALIAVYVVAPPQPAPPPGPAPRGGRSAMAGAPTATPLGADMAELELMSVALARPRWLIVSGTQGAGAYLRNSRNLTDRKIGLVEGALLFDRGGSPDPAWLRVTVAPGGPEGWIPTAYTASVP